MLILITSVDAQMPQLVINIETDDRGPPTKAAIGQTLDLLRKRMTEIIEPILDGTWPGSAGHHVAARMTFQHADQLATGGTAIMMVTIEWEDEEQNPQFKSVLFTLESITITSIGDAGVTIAVAATTYLKDYLLS